MFRITVLISGSGTNLQALMDAAGTPSLPNAQITHVISSRSAVKGLDRAATATPPISSEVCALKTHLNKNPGSTRRDYDREVARRVVESRPDLVVLAGWMHILSQDFLDIVEGRSWPPPAPTYAPSFPQHQSSSSPSSLFPIPCINLHPALPGAFDGAHAIERAFEAFHKGEVKNTGVMVHKVVAEVDAGKPLVVREVEIMQEDKIEDLEERMHAVEHRIIVEGAKVVLESKSRTESANP